MLFPQEHNSSKPSDPFIGKILLSKYVIISKLGEGSFGKTYKVSTSNDTFFAIKLEKRSDSSQLLEMEGLILNYLKGPGIPFFEAYSSVTDYNILVMQLLGKSLEKTLSTMPNKTFSIRTVCNLAIQMISILKHIHNNHVIHRDLKPDNFTVGLNNENNKVYLIDFGLAKKYRSSKTLEHFPLKKGKKLTGTARYASINALGGLEQSRRDDLESIAYVLIYLLKGKLPWQGLPMKKVDERYVKIYEKKKSVSPLELCIGFPKQFEEFVTYTRKLGYKEDPNYEYLQQLMKDVLKEKGYSFDYYTEWSCSNLYEMSNQKNNILTIDRYIYHKNSKTFSDVNHNSNRSNIAKYQSINRSNDNDMKFNENNDSKQQKENVIGVSKGSGLNENEIEYETGINNFDSKDKSEESFYKVTIPIKRNKSVDLKSHKEILLQSNMLSGNNKGNKTLDKKNNECNFEYKTYLQQEIFLVEENEMNKKNTLTLKKNKAKEEKVNNNDKVINSEGFGDTLKQNLQNQNTKSLKGLTETETNSKHKENKLLYKKSVISEHKGSCCCIM